MNWGYRNAWRVLSGECTFVKVCSLCERDFAQWHLQKWNKKWQFETKFRGHCDVSWFISTFQKVNEASSILSKEHKCETAVIVCVLLRIAGFISNYVYVLLENSVNQYNSE